MPHTDPENVSGMVLRIMRGNERSLRISLPLPLNVTVTPAGCCRTERPGGTVTMSRRAKRCDSGCCAATATYSITAKKIAASLIAQFRANSCPMLTGIDELPDEELVDGSIPLRRTDHFLDDDPIPVDHEALGYAGRLIDLLDAPALVLEDLEAEPQLPHELHDAARVAVVDADGDVGRPVLRFTARNAGARDPTPTRSSCGQIFAASTTPNTSADALPIPIVQCRICIIP